ncbi:unnamed protein product [Anisakis simplex]|uniref:Bromo domain-containing protein n=1 Tax=Anisakis simplex TaxID=6269 RepID=A0A0M3K6B3_ANISI|nr:unnamed protein product [Anisakis simplex]
MSVELYSIKLLPWKRLVDKEAVLVLKEKFFIDPNPEIFQTAPQGYKSISKYVDNLTFEEEPNYTLIQSALEQIIKDECMDIRLPLDWNGKVFEKEETRMRLKEREYIGRKRGATRESRDVSLEREDEQLEQVDINQADKENKLKQSSEKAATQQLPVKSVNVYSSDDSNV